MRSLRGRDLPTKVPSSRSAKTSNDVAPSAPRAPWHALHQTLGNRGVQRLLRAPAIQAKLRVSQPNDPYEQEADRVAAQVLAEPGHLDVISAPPRIQRYTEQASGQAETAPASVNDVLAGSGRPLDRALRQDMEPRFGHDFSTVRVYSGAAAEQSAQDVDAKAYTVGSDIVFGAGEFTPGTREGRRLLAHELTHVVQQGSMAPESLRRAPRKKKESDTVDVKTAQRVMEWILIIVDKVYVDPSGGFEASLSKRHRNLLSLWYQLTYGRRTNGSTAKLEGEEFLTLYERAKPETEPLLKVVIQKGGGTWHQLLVNRWYPRYYDFERRADSEKNIIKIRETEAQTLFWLSPTPEPVSLDDFINDVTKQDSQVVPLQGTRGPQVGTAKAGIPYYASQQEPRLLLWASPAGVFFVLDDQIYKQSLSGFSDDIIIGAFIKAAQDVGPFVEFLTFVIDLAISVSPIGPVYDLTMGAKAAAEGRWGDAALEILPGPALGKLAKLGKATRIGRAAFRGAAKGAQFVGKALAGAATFVGKGMRKIGEKFTRGLWIVAEGAGEGAGKKAYFFMDEADNVLRHVDEEEAVAFITCTKCKLTGAGKGEVEVVTKEATTEAATKLGKINKAKPGALKELAGKIHGLRRLGGQAVAVVEVRVGDTIRYVAASNASAPFTRAQKQALKSLGIEVAEGAKGIKEVIHAEHNIEYWVKNLRNAKRRADVLRWGISAGAKGAYVCSGCRAIVENLGGLIEEFGPTLGKL